MACGQGPGACAGTAPRLHSGGVGELSRYLFLAGAVPYIVLGVAHAIATPRDPQQRRGLSPRDPQLSQSMTRTAVLLTSRTDMWRAWVGFNLSHSLGVILLGVVVLVVGRSEASFAREAGVFVPLATCAAAAYLLLGLKYWFRTPIIGCALSLGLFVASWLLRTTSGS